MRDLPVPIDAWLFDLDNTLYPHGCDLFALVDERMGGFIADRLAVDRAEARRIQKRYFASHGTTLAGLMAEHDVEPRAFLDHVHDVPLDRLREDALLVEAIARLPGRKLVFTNGDAAYAARVLDRLGLGDAFEGVHDIHAMGLVPKPAPASYAALCKRWAIDPASALFVDDMAKNLAPAKALGMTTVWLDNGSEQAEGRTHTSASPSFVDIRITDLAAWLHDLTKESA